MTRLVMDSPVGRLAVDLAGDLLVAVDYAAKDSPLSSPEELAGNACTSQLGEYFAGRRTEFELACRPEGSTFQQAVWKQLSRIPFGATMTYGEVASAIGRPSASRAVGAACGKNPLSIVVPCHRVVGTGNRLTGYAGGLDRKAWLLAFERGNSPG